MAKLIQSPHNPLVKFALTLRKSSQRAEQQRFLVDGFREIDLALRNRFTPHTIFVPERLEGERHNRLLELVQRVPDSTIAYCSAEVLQRLQYGDRTTDPVGVFHSPRFDLQELPRVERPLIAILDRLEKPGNLGAVLRSADACGVHAVLISNPICDVLNPNAIRASRGTIFTVPIAVASIPECVQWLRAQDIQIFATRVDGAACYLDADFRGPTAFVFGSESHGLSEAWRHETISTIALPMQGQADSLNVSNTAAVLFYETVRQRRLFDALNHQEGKLD